MSRVAQSAGIVLRELTPVVEPLEELFLRMTGDEDAALAAARAHGAGEDE